MLGLFFPIFRCPGAEAYERKADANGLYMTHLLKNITQEATVETMLKKVAQGMKIYNKI